LVKTLICAIAIITLVQTNLQGREGLVRSRFGVVDVDVGLHVQFTGPYTAVVRWDTLDARDSIVEYWTIESLGLRAKDSSATTTHEITLSDLQYRSLYYYRVGYTNSAT